MHRWNQYIREPMECGFFPPAPMPLRSLSDWGSVVPGRRQGCARLVDTADRVGSRLRASDVDQAVRAVVRASISKIARIVTRVIRSKSAEREEK